MNHYASSFDLGWLADPDPFPTRHRLIASKDRTRLNMKMLVEQLPEWL